MITNAVYTLSNVTATKVVAASTLPQEVHLHNQTKSSNNYIFLGNSSVSTANSMHIDPGQTIRLQLMPNDDLWAVSDPDGLVIGVLTIRQN
jgi:hypothetical protein